jgi:hypothetical protein
LRHRIIKKDRFSILLLASIPPENEVISPERLRPRLRITVDVRQCRGGATMSQICNEFTEWLKLIKSLPFGELGGAYFPLRLVDRLT